MVGIEYRFHKVDVEESLISLMKMSLHAFEKAAGIIGEDYRVCF